MLICLNTSVLNMKILFCACWRVEMYTGEYDWCHDAITHTSLSLSLSLSCLSLTRFLSLAHYLSLTHTHTHYLSLYNALTDRQTRKHIQPTLNFPPSFLSSL